MRLHLNSGHDIETASQMITAIESSGGMAGVSVTVSGPQPAQSPRQRNGKALVSLTTSRTPTKVCMFGELMELVLVNLYPGEITVNKPGLSFLN